MALTVNHPLLKEQTVFAFSPSIGATPVAAYTRAGFRGKVIKVGVIPNGVVTTADCSVAYTINGTAVTGSPFILASTGAAAGTGATSIPTGANTVNEDDYISFTPSGAGGASISGQFFAVIQAA